MEVILYNKECNWYTRCCPLNRGVHYRERGYTVESTQLSTQHKSIDTSHVSKTVMTWTNFFVFFS